MTGSVDHGRPLDIIFPRQFFRLPQPASGFLCARRGGRALSTAGEPDMNTTLTLIDLAGAVALLFWATRCRPA